MNVTQRQYEALSHDERFLFDAASKAYFKATETSDPQHWMEAAMLAQQHRNALTKLNGVAQGACSGCAGITHTHTCGDHTKGPQLQGAAQCALEPTFTDDALNAAVSEYYDMSPRSGWSEAQRVGMRKAILVALSALTSTPGQAIEKTDGGAS